MSRDAHSTHDEPALGKAYDARLMRRLARYVAPHRAIVLGALALMLLASAAQLVQPWLVKLAIDEHIAKGEPRGLGTLALAFLAALAGEFVLRFAELYVLQRAGQDVLLDLRMALFAHLERLSSSFFDRHPVGRLMTRLTTDIEALNEAFTSGLIVALADGVKLLAIVVILLWMDWRLALVTFAILPPTLLLTALFRPRMREAYRAVRRWIARVNAFLQESVSGMRVLQLFSRERAAMEQFREINAAHRDAQLSGVRYDSMFSALAEWIGAVALAAIVAGGGFSILEGLVTFGTLVAFIDYAGKFFGPVQELSQRYTIMQSAMASAERIFELLDTEVAIRSPAARPSVAPRARGEIVFEGVTFGYNPGEPVLRDVTLHIRPGERVGIVGWTGSGKSTLIRLLVRLYDVWDGRILLDGVDVRDHDVSDLRRRIGLVLQDPFLFAGSVASNISLDDPAITPERVRGAARTAHADRFIELLPHGYDEPVRERGSNFSVGQKQLLSFARAVAFDPAVLVLDEATASVDPATEHDIREGLARLLAGRTSIVIAHRLATVREADRVLVLHHGRLVEQGSHEELLRLPEGIYRTLYGLQAGA